MHLQAVRDQRPMHVVGPVQSTRHDERASPEQRCHADGATRRQRRPELELSQGNFVWCLRWLCCFVVFKRAA